MTISKSGIVENLKVRGDILFELTDPDGNKRIDRETNLVVTAGRSHIANQLTSQSQAAMSHMAIGDPSPATAPVAGDTALESELDRNALDSKTQGTGGDANKVTYVATWAPGDGTGAITEAGIFNSGTSGTMLARTTFAVKNKGVGDSLTITWVLTVSS